VLSASVAEVEGRSVVDPTNRPADKDLANLDFLLKKVTSAADRSTE
jgi:hypothetical protein